MKKIASFLLCLLIAVGAVTPAAAKTDGDYEYVVFDELFDEFYEDLAGREITKGCEITAYNGAGGDVVVPSTLGGFAVLGIGDDAFCGCDTLTSVTIPDGVVSIGHYAFYDCTALTSVTLPDSVMWIVENAFDGTALCNNPSNWTGDVLYIGNRLIQTKETLSGAYEILPGTVMIAEHAFYNCPHLTSVTIPEGVREIPYRTFCGCTSLASVTIPDSVTKIGGHAFDETALYKNPSNWTGDVLYIGSRLIEAKVTLSGAYEILPGTTMMADGAFWGCDLMKSVTIPDGVTEISNAAFDYCSSLTEVTIPDSVTKIGMDSFGECKSLANVTIPDSVTKIGARAFAECTSLTSVTISANVTRIGCGAFAGCVSLPEIEVDPSNPFYTSADGVLFTKDGKCLHSYPAGKPGETCDIPDGVTEIGDGAFAGCAHLTGVTIPDGVTRLGCGVFEDCKSLAEVTIPASVTEIGEGAFYDCVSLTEVTIPAGVTALGEDTFEDCESLVKVTIPASVTSIGDYAFDDCEALAEVYYGGTEEQWQAIEIGDYNWKLTKAAIHYNCLPPAEKGDVNGDGSVDNLDASLILQYDAGITDDAGISRFDLADVNGDGKADNLDAALVLQYDAGLIEDFQSAAPKAHNSGSNNR